MKKLYLFLWIMLLSTFQAAAYVFTYQGFQIETDGREGTIIGFPSNIKNAIVPGTVTYNNGYSTVSYTITSIGITKANDTTGKCIESLSLPASIKELNNYYYDEYDYGYTESRTKCMDLPNLKDITVDLNNKYFKDKDGILYSKDEKLLIQIPPKHTKKIEISNDINSIENRAFNLCDSTMVIYSYIEDNPGILNFGTWDNIRTIHIPIGTKCAYRNSGGNWYSYSLHLIEDIPTSSMIYNGTKYIRKSDSTVSILRVLSNSSIVEDKFVYHDTTYTVTSIIKGAFSNVSEAKFPKLCHITEIPDSCFYNFSKIEIPTSIEKIGNNVFSNKCDSIKVDEGNTNFFVKNNILYCTKETHILYVPNQVSGNITLPDELVSFNDSLFKNRWMITGITISDKNPYFHSYCGILYNNSYSKFIYIPEHLQGVISIHEGIKGIGDFLFYNKNIEELYLPKSVNNIGIRICSGYCKIYIDSTNQYLSILDNTIYNKNRSQIIRNFYGSTYVSNNINEISDSAFYKNAILIFSSKNPSSIKVSNASFADCDSCVLRVPYGYANVYKSLDWVSNNPNCYYWHDSLGNYSYERTGATKKYGFIIEEYSQKEPGSSFKANGILYKILSDGKSVEADSVVSWNSELLPDSVSYDNSSFIVKGINGNLNKYSYLQNIPASVNSICANAFSGIRSKVTIHSRIVNPDSVCKGSTFNNVDKTIVLYVPVGTKNAYKNAKGWNQFATILEEGEQNPLDNNFRINGISYEKNSDGKTVTITGATANANTIPDSITYAGIHYAVTSVSYNALDSMKYVHIPASVLNIDYYNYLHGNIERFDVDSLNQNYASLDGILYDKKYSKIIYVPAKIKGRISLHDNLMMSKYDFTNRQITSATIPANITLEDDDSSFFHCSNLQSVYSYSKNPVGNWQSAFYGDSMATLYVPLGTKSLYVKQGADKSFRNIVEILIDKPIVNVSSTDSCNKVTITWERVTSAIKYHITLFRDKDLTDTVAHYWVAPDGTSLRSEKTYVNHTISGLQKGKYYFTLLAQGINERMGYAEGDFSILKEANATNIKTVNNDNAEIVSTRYFDLNGREIPAPHKNSISICVNRYSNGTNKSYKIFVR